MGVCAVREWVQTQVTDLFDAYRTSRIREGERLFRDARPIAAHTFVVRTEGYTYAAKVRALSVVQGPFAAAPCQAPTDRFASNESLTLSSNWKPPAWKEPATVHSPANSVWEVVAVRLFVCLSALGDSDSSFSSSSSSSTALATDGVDVVRAAERERERVSGTQGSWGRSKGG
jgi:hypothetical protein